MGADADRAAILQNDDLVSVQNGADALGDIRVVTPADSCFRRLRRMRSVL